MVPKPKPEKNVKMAVANAAMHIMIISSILISFQIMKILMQKITKKNRSCLL